MFLLLALANVLPKRFPLVYDLRYHVSDLNQIIMIFHSLTVAAESMSQRESMIFLFVEPLIFNFPAALSVKGRKPARCDGSKANPSGKQTDTACRPPRIPDS